MIKKINKIHNVLSYSFFDWDQINPVQGSSPNNRFDVFKANNIFFAENTNGKSNLIKMFKHLNGDTSVGLSKNWDFNHDTQEIRLLLDDNSEIIWDSTNWSSNALQNKFIIFDKHFIERYVHSVGLDDHNTAQRRQERGRHIVYLGDFAQYNDEINKVNQIKKILRDKNETLLEKEEGRVKGIIPDWLEDSEINKKYVEGLDIYKLSEKQENLEKERLKLEKINNATKNKNTIEALTLLDKKDDSFCLEVENVNEKGNAFTEKINPNELFSFTASKGVKTTLDKINHKKSFVKSGVDFIDKETKECPFCEQSIRNGELLQIIQDYQKIFDETFIEEENKVKKCLQKYHKLIVSLRDLQAPSQNSTNFQTIKKYIHFENELPDCSLSENDKKLINDEIGKISQKENNILDLIAGSKIDNIKQVIEEANDKVKEYNDIIVNINDNVKKLKKDVSEGKLTDQIREVKISIRDLEKDILFIT